MKCIASDPLGCAAVLYLRASSKGQMNTAIDLDPDGLSIHTPREHGMAKADSLNTGVADEFVEPRPASKIIASFVQVRSIRLGKTLAGR